MRGKLLMATLAVLVSGVPAFAHHGFTVEFDASKCGDMKGTLTGITWENPHAYLQMDVKDKDGQVATPYCGTAGYIMLQDHTIRPVGQIKGGPPPDPKDF